MSNLAPAIFPSAYGMRMCPNNFTVTRTFPFPGEPTITIVVTQRDRGWYNVVETSGGKTHHYVMSYPEACRLYRDAWVDLGGDSTTERVTITEQ